eukprot:339124-Chlamydomonas_euryale.AAC.1
MSALAASSPRPQRAGRARAAGARGAARHATPQPLLRQDSRRRCHTRGTRAGSVRSRRCRRCRPSC